jgi:hypothetical protein
MRTIEEVIGYLEERKEWLAQEIKEESGYVRSAYDGGYCELEILLDFINEKHQEEKRIEIEND